MYRVILFVLGGIAVVSGAVVAADPASNRIVFPIATDLQRMLVEDANCKAVVFINGSEIVIGSTIDAAAIGLDGMQRELKPYADKEVGAVDFRILYDQKTGILLREVTDVLTSTFEGFGRRVGFRTVKISWTGYVDWQKTIADVNDKTRVQADGDEPSLGDDLVKVYPARTILSRYLTQNMDCVVDILVPLNTPGDEVLNPAIRESILKHVPKIHFAERKWISYRIRNRTSSPAVVEEFVKDQSITKLLEFEQQSIASLGQ